MCFVAKNDDLLSDIQKSSWESAWITAELVPSFPLAPVEILLIHTSNLMQTEFKDVLRFLGWGVKHIYFTQYKNYLFAF